LGGAVSYEVELSIHQEYLRFEVSGERSLEEAERLFRQIARESAARNVCKVLLVFNLRGRISTIDIHDLVSKYREFGLTAKHKIVVVDKNRKTASDQDFAVNVARNRGLNGASFANEAAALDWLFA